MERAEAYSKLLERVRKAGGYFAFDEKNRPLATTSDGKRFRLLRCLRERMIAVR